MPMLRRILDSVALFLLRGGDSDMVVVYLTLVIHNRRTFDSVPANLKDAVKEELKLMGLGTDGKPLPLEEIPA